MSESTQTQPSPTIPQPDDDGGMGPHSTPTEVLQRDGDMGPRIALSIVGTGETASPTGGMGPHS